MNNIVLLEPEVPGNTGNIMRTCVATNAVLHIIKPIGFSLEDKYVKRSAANYIENLKYYVYENYEEFKLKNKGIYYFFTRYGKKDHTSFNYKKSKDNIYLIFGKESAGIPKNILKDNLNNCMRIPMSKDVRSLNLSNCVSTVIYEVLRQQDFNDLLMEEPHKSKDYITD